MKRTRSKNNIYDPGLEIELSQTEQNNLTLYASYKFRYEDLTDNCKNYLMLRDKRQYGIYDIECELLKISELEDLIEQQNEKLEHQNEQIDYLSKKIEGIFIAKKMNKFDKLVHNTHLIINELPLDDSVKKIFRENVDKVEDTKTQDLDERINTIIQLHDQFCEIKNDMKKNVRINNVIIKK